MQGAPAQIRAFEAVFVAVLTTEYWCRAVPKWEALSIHYTTSLVLVPVLAVLAMVGTTRMVAFWMLAVNHAVVIWNEFPATGNHAYLELIVCVFAALHDPRRHAEAQSYLGSLRWIPVVVFIYSGVQKLAHGYWFRGQYLAYSLATESFRPVLRPLLSAAELDRLVSLPHEIGAGPFLVDSLPLLIASNAIWVGEIALAPMLLFARTRRAAAVIGLLLLAAIEVGAREVFFGLVFADLLLLSLVPRIHRIALPVALVVCACLLASRLGVLPAFTFY